MRAPRLGGWAGRGQSCLALDHTYCLQRLHMDSVSKSRSMADGRSLRSMAQWSARSLQAPRSPPTWLCNQVRAPATPRPRF